MKSDYGEKSTRSYIRLEEIKWRKEGGEEGLGELGNHLRSNSSLCKCFSFLFRDVNSRFRGRRSVIIRNVSLPRNETVWGGSLKQKEKQQKRK